MKGNVGMITKIEVKISGRKRLSISDSLCGGIQEFVLLDQDGRGAESL